MDKQKLIKLLIKHAKGFPLTQVTKEFKKNEKTATKVKQSFVPGDIRAIQLLIQLQKSDNAGSEDRRFDSLTVEQTIEELRAAVNDSEQTIRDYESALENHLKKIKD